MGGLRFYCCWWQFAHEFLPTCCEAGSGWPIRRLPGRHVLPHMVGVRIKEVYPRKYSNPEDCWVIDHALRCVCDGRHRRALIVDAEFAAGETIDGYTDDAKDPDYGDNTVHAGIGELDGKNHWQDDELVTAFFDEYTNVLYTSYDTACETAFHAVEPCLDKGDMLFVIDSNYYAGKFHSGTAERPDGGNLLSSSVATYGTTATHESGNIYTIKKIYKEDPTEQTFDTEDRYRIVVDKNIPFSGLN